MSGLRRVWSRGVGKAAQLLLWLAVVGPAAGSVGKLGPLAPRPDWGELEKFQGTITRAEFVRLLDRVYAPGGAARGMVSVGEEGAVISAGAAGGSIRLRFAASEAEARGVGRYWRAAREMGPPREGRPLEGVRVAIDPGHIGGRWARIEERWFQIGGGAPVMEGDMVMVVAGHLRQRLESLGARVLMVREGLEPVTRHRPEDLMDEARAWLAERGFRFTKEGYSGPHDPGRFASVRWNAELLFYRVGEIRARAERVNARLRPDVTVCLHFNAEDWGDPARPTLVRANHLHLLLNGRYGADELKYEDQRFDMLVKLLGRSWPEELAISEAVANSMARVAGLQPYEYAGANAIRAGQNPYLWVRNLLANRLYQCPVVYLEPYVMNSREAYARIQAGDYEGTREIGGRPRESIFREYARGVSEGLAAYYRESRR